MTTKDISRHLLQPEKHYSGLRLQQGRIILDSDFNESAMIAGEDQRLVVADVIGPHGSSDDGFKITDVNLVEYDFKIVAGSYYVGGIRLDLDEDEDFLAQQDWLQSSRSDVILPALPDVLRDDLIYMVAWEQEVCAVEDQEIVEQALSGPDTSVRVRRMRRVYAHTDTSADCSDAFADLKTLLTKEGLHTWDSSSGELLSGARLKVGPSNSGEIQDLCQPAPIEGYVGAENQAIRIQLIDTDRFLWSYDNASPLYRISLPNEVAPDVYELTFETPPKDQAHHPLIDQVLEILPWGASLPNGEVTADHSIAADIGGGVFAKVISPYNPKTRTVEVELVGADLQPFVDWFDPEVPLADRFLFLRHWRPGGMTEDTIGIHFVPDTPRVLGGSGLQVTFTSEGIIGDTWIIAARPSTPTIAVPWEFTDIDGKGALPNGPRRFYAPLAMLHWTLVDDVLGVTVESCRRTFRALTEQGGCCTFTVGDGDQSFGDYRTISDALDALPPAGGKVCVLPGVYEERIVLTDRSDITIEGCESRTIIRTPADNDTSEGLITLTGCERITIRKLAIDATAQVGVLLMPDEAGQQGPVSLHDLAINTQRDPADPEPDANELWMPSTPAPFPCPTIAAYQIVGLDVCRCTLTMLGDLSSMANVLLRQTSLSTIRDSSILTIAPPGANAVTTAWGGLQLAGGCESVEVIHNEIRGGMGHGITLGSALFVGSSLAAFPDIFSAGNHGVIDPGEDCPGLEGGLDEAIPPGGGDDTVETTPDTPLSTIKIVDNLIHKMHGCGISVLAYWPEPSDLAAFKMIETHDVLIDRNRIVDNFQKPAENLPDAAYLDVLAFGGITLGAADDLRIFDNIITDNGLDHLRAVCGIFVLHGENINIERNRIKNNGPRITGDGTAGIRAGIAIQMAGRRIDYNGTGPITVDEDTFDNAAGIRGNVVIQPVGRALQLYGIGPMVVTGNHLVGGGLTGSVPKYEAHAVEIINLGQSPELISDGTMPSFYGFLPVPPIQGDPDILDERLIDGRILYSNNQARLVVDGAPAEDMHCAFRLLSHGDVMMQGNQHVTTFDRSVGHLDFSTTAIGWSVNVCNNRSEDTHLNDSDPAELATEISIVTTGAMNITSSNIATRCILAFVGSGTQINTEQNIFSTNNIVYYRTALIPNDNCGDYATEILYWLVFPG